MSEMTHKPEALFAIEDEPSHPDLSRGLANYRRLNASERAACAAELKRRVEIEIVDQKCRSRRRQKGLVAVVVESIFGVKILEKGSRIKPR